MARHELHHDEEEEEEGQQQQQQHTLSDGEDPGTNLLFFCPDDFPG